jgi:hypothetical protein
MKPMRAKLLGRLKELPKENEFELRNYLLML